ncbi:MAG: hypothetical protein ACRD18_01515 [Terriglobia bacterium]
MESLPSNLKLTLSLDLETYSDVEARQAMVEAFPASNRPDVNLTLHLSEPSIQYIVLTVIVGVSWALKKVLGPSLDELGNHLRDSLRACLKYRKRVPPGVGLHVIWTDIEVRVSIEAQSLLGWSDAKPYFQKLDEYLAHGLEDAPSKDAHWISLRWDPDRQRWIFTQVLAARGSKFDYYVFDREQNKWIGKNEV